MATVGQIIYNVQDYQNSGGYISTSASNKDIIISSDRSDYDTAKINIFDSNIIKDKFGGGPFTKLGVNAPPGTRFILNGNKTILVGRSGIYELDSDIDINSIQFIRPRRYVLNQVATEEALKNGIKGFAGAEIARSDELKELGAVPLLPAENESFDLAQLEANKKYWGRYKTMQDTYDKTYQDALSQYNMGLNGIYKLPNDTDLEAKENYEDLYNIIIDFLY